MPNDRRQGERLAELIRSGDIESLAREVHPLVEGVVCRAIGARDRDTVTTATDDAIFAACRHCRSFRGDSSPLTWITTIARRAAFRAAKQERARRMPSLDDGARSALGRHTEEDSPGSVAVILSRVRARLNAALAAPSPREPRRSPKARSDRSRRNAPMQ